MAGTHQTLWLWTQHTFYLSLPWLFGWTSWHLQVGMTCFGQCPYSPYQEFCLHHAMNIFDKGFLKLRVPEKELHLKLCFVRFRMVLIEFPPTCRHRGCGELQTRAPWDFQWASKDFKSKCTNCRFPVLICMNQQPRTSSWLLTQHDSQIGLLKLPSWWSVVSLLWEPSINTQLQETSHR